MTRRMVSEVENVPEPVDDTTSRLCSCAEGCAHGGCTAGGNECACHKVNEKNQRYCPCSS